MTVQFCWHYWWQYKPCSASCLFTGCPHSVVFDARSGCQVKLSSFWDKIVRLFKFLISSHHMWQKAALVTFHFQLILHCSLSSFRLTLPQSRLFSGSTTSMVLPIEWSTWWRKRTNRIAQINEIKQEHQPLHLSPMRIIPNCSNVNKLSYAIVNSKRVLYITRF